MIGISKLRKNYKSYESKRKLVATYDLFFAERAIIPMLPPLLGKAFYVRKKYVLLCVVVFVAHFHQDNLSQ